MNNRLAVRERTEEYERITLSTWATLATETKGRDRYEEPDPLRTAFQQDRDRILHTTAFRRLNSKTHVFLHTGEHYRSRLTHTLEVATLARTTARALRLNEDLAEAIALAHDLGRPPFGAAGEQALALALDAPFLAGEQSLRVVEALARGSRGLNLTWEVQDGIVRSLWTGPVPATPEGQVVRLADRVAALNHELEDAVRSRLIDASDVPAEVIGTLGASSVKRLSTVVEDLVATSLDRPEVQLGKRMTDVLAVLSGFLDQQVYRRQPARGEHDRACHCLSSLAVYYLDNLEQLPESATASGVPAQRVTDHLAGLGDEQALRLFSRLFLPGS